MWFASRLASVFALLVTLCLPAVARSAESQPTDHSAPERESLGDSVWLVSTRHLGEAVLYQGEPLRLDIRRYVDGTGWESATVDDFAAAADPEVITVAYVHGNRFDWGDAIYHGWRVYEALGPRDTRKPVRMVIWSWPSSRIHGPMRDVRVKGWRAHSESIFLARFIAEHLSGERISLVGYSYGARIATGALHVLAGGRLFGMEVDAPANVQPARVVMMAAAMGNDWLLPRGLHERAYLQTDKMLILYNTCDPALDSYHLVESCRARALGYTGLPTQSHWQDRVEQRNVADLVGKSHDELRYWNSPALTEIMRRYLLWDPLD